ncbi:MAG: hydroxyethylthiazole kinase [Candidatus Neptunochlamydia sp.]|nr:hydroxyethylthiazole kinase [Candidatus Neptunochlamydia sp.]
MKVPIDLQCVWSDIQAIKKSYLLIHIITNYVVVESTANGLLAIGASLIIAHALDVVNIASSLVLNIGTLSPFWIQGMMVALKAADSKSTPIILDPVGAGATSYRTKTAHSILDPGTVEVIRGNPSGIASLAITDTQALASGDKFLMPKAISSMKERLLSITTVFNSQSIRSL